MQVLMKNVEHNCRSERMFGALSSKNKHTHTLNLRVKLVPFSLLWQ